jgi:hypothetical protein
MCVRINFNLFNTTLKMGSESDLLEIF